MRKIFFKLTPHPKNPKMQLPVLEITFQNPNSLDKIFPTIGIIDSGADYCTIPFKTQKDLGLDLKKIGAQKTGITCACGSKSFFGYLYKLNILVNDSKGNQFTKLIWVEFAESDTIPLIGRNFMDLFKRIKYDNLKKEGFFIDTRKIEEDD